MATSLRLERALGDGRHRCYLCVQMKQALEGEATCSAAWFGQLVRWAGSHKHAVHRTLCPHCSRRDRYHPSGGSGGVAGCGGAVGPIFQQQPTHGFLSALKHLSHNHWYRRLPTLGVGFMMWFLHSCLEVSTSAQGSGSPSAAGILPPVFSIDSCLCHLVSWVLWVLYQCSLVWNWRCTLSITLFMSLADAGDTVQSQAALALVLNLKNVFTWPQAFKSS